MNFLMNILNELERIEVVKKPSEHEEIVGSSDISHDKQHGG
jgi:hypothetical protein